LNSRSAVTRALLLGLQLFLTAAALAFLPGAGNKLLAFLVVWLLSFRKLTTRELVAYAVVCALFSVMDILAVRQGVLRFSFPDYAGLPVWEYFMWGFFVLHAIRMLGGPPPGGPYAMAIGLALVFAAPFASLSDPAMLLGASGLALALALAAYHARWDLAYVGYMIAVGAIIEYTGVWSGAWSYPDAPPGGVPPWFVPMWGGVGLFTRRLIVPHIAAGR